IIEPFLREYSLARTPNPCVVCNETVKFRAMADFADEIGAKFIATGHYAQIEDNLIKRGVDKVKDQAYFLYRLPKDIILRTIFPLQNMDKSEAYAIARELGLSVAERKESTEICFFPRGELREFLDKNGVCGEAGNFIDPEGNVIGRHEGWTHYTLGQRRGIGVPSSEGRLYVVKIDAENALITLGPREMLMKSNFAADNSIFHIAWPIGETRSAEVQIRHGGRTSEGEITRTGEQSGRIELNTPLFAPAPGQSAVFFESDRVIGGGIIEEIPQ
ncbi:MAG TPA: tRNA 2-thiouridine(34) synthase MnmA, partial [candidate division Zixibacteria bacterium]|nr:tRNA 2-thiouridine(34) synthase MnmA [candidate division Zixibacteria bacterium]